MSLLWFNLTLNKFNSDWFYSENKWYMWTAAGHTQLAWRLPRPVSLASSYPQALEYGFIKKASGAARASVILE